MNPKLQRAITLGLTALVCAAPLVAGPFGGAASAAGEAKGIASAAGGVLGGLVTVIGGSYAAWKAAHEQPFTTPLVCAIAGAAIAAVSVA